MMHSIFYLYINNYRKNKKEVRTYILSILLCIFCVNFILICMKSNQQEVLEYNSFYYGDYHLLIEKNDNVPVYVKEKIVSLDFGFKDHVTYKNNDSYDLYAVNNVSDKKPLAEMQGKLPSTSSELCITKQIADDYQLKVGDYIHLKNEINSVRYKICGIYNGISTPFNMQFNHQILLTYEESISKEYSYIWVEGLTSDVANKLMQDCGLTCNISLLSNIQIISESISLKLLNAGFVISVLISCIFLTAFMIMEHEKKRDLVKQLKQVGFSKKDIKLYMILNSLVPILIGFVLSMILSWIVALFRYEIVYINVFTCLIELILLIIFVCCLNVFLLKLTSKEHSYRYAKKDDDKKIIKLLCDRTNQKYYLSHCFSVFMSVICILYFVLNCSLMYPYMKDLTNTENVVTVRLNERNDISLLQKDLEFINLLTKNEVVNEFNANTSVSLPNAAVYNPKVDDNLECVLDLNIVSDSSYTLSNTYAYFQNCYDVLLKDGSIETKSKYTLIDELEIRTSQYVEKDHDYVLVSKKIIVPIGNQKETDMYFDRNQYTEEQDGILYVDQLYVTADFFMKYLYDEMYEDTPYYCFVKLYGDEELIISHINNLRNEYPNTVREVYHHSSEQLKADRLTNQEQLYFKTYLFISIIMMLAMFIMIKQISDVQCYQNKKIFKTLETVGWTNKQKLYFVLYNQMKLIFKTFVITSILLLVINAVVSVMIEFILFIIIVYVFYNVYVGYRLYKGIAKK